MKKENIYRTVWAKMPLEPEELKRVPLGHDVRPYLIVAEEKDFYYAFPCTSNVFGNKTRYGNCKLILRDQFTESGKSLVQLDKAYILPKKNIYYDENYGYTLPPDKINELLKKLKANNKFAHYPEAVMEQVNQQKTTFSKNDLISHNGQLFIIISRIKYQNGFYCLSVSPQPFNKAIQVIEDTNKYYVNVSEVHHIVPTEETEYISEIQGFSSLIDEMFIDDIKPYLKGLQNRTYTSKRLTYISSSFYQNQKIPFRMLEPGTVISYQEDGIDKKMVILKTDSTNQVVLEGLANQMYKDYSISYYPKDYNFPFKIENTISDERVETLIRKKLNSNPKRLQHIW